MIEFLKGLATTLWILFAIYGFYIVKKWNKRFSELYEEFKRNMGKEEPENGT